MRRGDLTKNISRHELACRCGCGYDAADMELVGVVQGTVDHFARLAGVERLTLRVHSGCRCEDYNHKVGGSEHSQHVIAKALDFSIPGTAPDAIAMYLHKKYPDKYGVGAYSTWVHFDVRPQQARWRIGG